MIKYFLLVLLSSCSLYRIDKDVHDYLEEFYADILQLDYKFRMTPLIVRVFRDEDFAHSLDYLAVCVMTKPREIQIRSKPWALMSNLQKKSLVYHEAGHCILDLPHDDRLMGDKCPYSLMYSGYISTNCLNEHFNDYKLRLFTGRKR